jgi:tryptophanase
VYAGPYPKDIFYSKNKYGKTIKIGKKLRIGIMYRGYRFQHNRYHIQQNEQYDKTVDQFIPFAIAYFRMEQYKDLSPDGIVRIGHQA